MLIRLLSCTVQSVIPVRIQYRYLQELQVSDPKLQNILSDTGPLEQFGKNRTSLVVENLKISNGKNKTSGHPFIQRYKKIQRPKVGGHSEVVSKRGRKRISHKHLRSNRRSVRYKQINLEYVQCESDHASSRVRTKQTQYESRLGVDKFRDKLRQENSQVCFNQLLR